VLEGKSGQASTHSLLSSTRAVLVAEPTQYITRSAHVDLGSGRVLVHTCHPHAADLEAAHQLEDFDGRHRRPNGDQPGGGSVESRVISGRHVASNQGLTLVLFSA
jgi:hypothetical protein